MQKKIRIAHVQLLPLITGVQKVSLDELNLLPGCYEKHLVCSGEGPLTDACRRSGIQVAVIEGLQRAIHPLRDVAAVRNMIARFRKLKPDVVHTHSSKTGFIGRIAARVSGVPAIIHTVHGFAFPATNSRLLKLVYYVLEWLGARCCHAMIVMNQSDYDFCRQWLQVPASRLHFIYNGIDLERFAPAAIEKRQALRASLDLAEGDFVFGMVGRLWEQKNPLLLLEASIALLKRESRSVKILFVGDGELREQMESRIAEAGLANQIHLLGWRTDVCDILKALDCFVLPSNWEGLPLSILEALSTGVPVIASDISGNRDAVKNGVDGLLFKQNDCAGLVGAMERLRMDKSLCEQMGQAGRARMKEVACVKKRAEKMDSIYSKLLAGS